jgi:hypothetical protein
MFLLAQVSAPVPVFYQIVTTSYACNVNVCKKSDSMEQIYKDGSSKKYGPFEEYFPNTLRMKTFAEYEEEQRKTDSY